LKILEWLKIARKPDFTIKTPDGEIYLLRWYIIPRNPYFNIYLHKFVHSDDSRALHDHMYVNLSILIKNGYMEQFSRGIKFRTAPCLILRKPSTLHRIQLHCDDNEKEIPAWSIFITGPRIREWGFMCPNKRWIPWFEFVKVEEGGNTHGRGCD